MNTVRKTMKTAVGVTTTALLGGAMVSAPAAAATPATADTEGDAPAPSASVQADINGDGGPELVTLRESGAEHVVSARFADHSYVESAFPADSSGRFLLEPRVADLNRDGTAEIIAATEAGANTVTFTAFTYVPEQGLVRISDAEGAAFDFHDGGGATARVSYGCYGPDDDGATFRIVKAQRSDVDGSYHGVRTTYALQGDTFVRSGQDAFTGLSEEAPELQADPASCDPS